jgi:YesN/AraC family two-component response regulator
VVSVPDGAEALRYLEKGKLPSFVITDLMMPNMDGFTLCKEIKKTRRTANIPVVVVSAIPEDEARIQSLEFGADAYLEKPFTFELLETTLKGLLENRERIYTHYSAYPIVSTEQGISGADEKLLLRIQDYILEHLSDTSLRVEDIAQVACMSKSNLLKKMKAIVRMSPGEFVLEIRLKKAKEFLLNDDLSIGNIAYSVGYSDPLNFSKIFKKKTGLSPKDYRLQFNKKRS